MKRGLTLLAILFSFIDTYSQSLKGTYYGHWADTNWKFDFSNNNSYKWTTSGHFGDNIIKGNYKIHFDTLILTSGYENKDVTINKYYLIDGDSCIIDIEIKYDYCKTKPIKVEKDGKFTESYRKQRLRNIMYPQLPTDNKSKINEVENILSQVINWTELEKYYHSDNDSTRRTLVIKNYYEIKENNGIELNKFGKPVVFKSADEIKKEV